MNLATLLPTVLVIMMTITSLVQAAPNAGEKAGARREAGAEREGAFDGFKDMTPEKREAFLKAHPEFKEHID